MLAAVTPSSRFENLGGGYRSAATNPVTFGGNAPGVRQSVAPPTSVMPGVQAPIHTSSAKPSRGTNIVIPYSRVAFNLETDMQHPIEQGDVMFVERPDNDYVPRYGGAPNYASKVLSLDKLNNILARQDDMDVVMDADNSPFGEVTSGSKGDIEPANHTKWTHCKALAAWSVDGVAINVDDEGSDSTRLGVLCNVAVSGPTPFKSCDSRSHTLNRVFVGVFAKKETMVIKKGKKTETKEVYRFVLKTFTERQLRAKDKYFGFDKLVGATVLGKVFDTHATSRNSTRPSMTVCVSVGAIDMAKMYDMNEEVGKVYNYGFGASVELADPLVELPPSLPFPSMYLSAEGGVSNVSTSKVAPSARP